MRWFADISCAIIELLRQAWVFGAVRYMGRAVSWCSLVDRKVRECVEVRTMPKIIVRSDRVFARPCARPHTQPRYLLVLFMLPKVAFTSISNAVGNKE